MYETERNSESVWKALGGSRYNTGDECKVSITHIQNEQNYDNKD